MNELNILEKLILFGFFSAFMLPISIAIGALITRVWDWVDDSETPTKENFVKSWWLSLVGWKYEKDFRYSSLELYTYVKEKRTEYGDKVRSTEYGEGIIILLLVLFFLPAVVYSSIVYYPIGIAIVTLFLLAHVARWSRRAQKAINNHIKDPNAHKEVNNEDS